MILTEVECCADIVEVCRMALNEKYDVITFPVTHYVYVEKIGPFQETAPKAWQEIHQFKESISNAGCKITGAFSMYKVESQLYRAGFSVSHEPETTLPEPLEYTLFNGGNYLRFVLTGSYMQLPKACGRVFEIVEKSKLPTTDNFYLENYVNDPFTTPESELKTEILIPTSAAAVPTK
jgi:predicted transcriptional regulator YdeE